MNICKVIMMRKAPRCITKSITKHPGTTELRLSICKNKIAITNFLLYCQLWKRFEILLEAGWTATGGSTETIQHDFETE